jgi:hypothetical protein
MQSTNLKEDAMRWLIRMVVFWAISAPLFYVFGLPYLLELLSKKAQTEGYTQCITLMTNEKKMGSPNSPLTQLQGETYCHCVSDHLIFTQGDLVEMVQKKPPTALTVLAQSLTTECNTKLQQSLGFLPVN